MTEHARKLCDELLGADRNKPLSLKGTGGVKFWDHDVRKDGFDQLTANCLIGLQALLGRVLPVRVVPEHQI